MNAVGYKIAEAAKNKSLHGLMQKLTESRKEEIMREAKATIDGIKNLHKTIKKNEEIEEAETNKVLEVAIKSFSGNVYAHLIKTLILRPLYFCISNGKIVFERYDI